jgi:hypothetical protein
MYQLFLNNALGDIIHIMQRTCDLSGEMIKYIEAKRDWVRNHYIPESISEYDTINGKLHLLDVILKSDWIENGETIKLQSLGITLGDVFVQDLGFIWVQVEDKEEIDPVLSMPDTSLILFPLTMISKRIERGESVDIYELYEGLKEKIDEIKFDA